MKKISIALLGLAMIGTTSVYAQDTDSYSLQREKLIQKYKNTKPLLISFYNSRNNELEINLTTNKYLPLANYLSDKFDRLVIFDIDTSSDSLTPEVLNVSDLVLTSPLMLNTLAEQNWKPLVLRNNNISPVFIVRKSDNINAVTDLKNKKLVSQAANTVTKYGLYTLIKAGVYTDAQESTKFYSETNNPDLQTLLKSLDDKTYDSIVLRDKDAKKLVAGSDKYQIIKSGFTGPDMLVYYGSKIQDPTKFKAVFLGMNEDNLTAKEALVSAREYTPGEKNQFIDLSPKDIQIIKDVILTTKK